MSGSMKLDVTFEIKIGGLDIEIKSERDGILTKKRKILKKNITFKIKNSLGATPTSDLKDPADYYLFIQQDAACLLSYGEMRPYLNIVGDGVRLKIPSDKIHLIIDKSKTSTKPSPTCFSYSQQKDQLQDDWLDSFK